MENNTTTLMCIHSPKIRGKGVHITPFYDSKFKNILIKKKQHHVPTGLPDDVEIIFLHYPTFEEAKEKWNRRVERTNWDNIHKEFSTERLYSRYYP